MIHKALINIHIFDTAEMHIQKSFPKVLCENGVLNDSHKENCILLSSLLELIEIEAFLHLTFFLCLHTQWISIHSIVTYQRVQIFEECDSSH